MAEDKQLTPENNMIPSAPDSDDSDEKKPVPESVSNEATTALPKARRLSFLTIDRGLKLAVSIILRLSIIVSFLILFLYLYRELNDKSYHIQEFQVPEDLVAMGYSGKVLAHDFQREVNEIIFFAGLTWSPKGIEEYNQSADKLQIQAEVGGLGISPETIVRYLKQVLGIPYRTITCEIVHRDDKLKLILQVTGEGVRESVIEEPVGKSVSGALHNLVFNAARNVVGINNPLLAGIFYSGDVSRTDLPHGDSLAIEMYKWAIRSKPTQAADAYAWWARSIINTSTDSILATGKLKRSLEIDPENASAYRFWGSLRFRNGDFKGGEEMLITSLKLDSTSASSWHALGLWYLRNGERDKDAERCLRKAYQLQPSNGIYSNSLSYALILNKLFKEAAMLQELSSSEDALKIVTLEGEGDTATAVQLFNTLRKRNSEDLSNDLNSFAFFLEGRKKDENEAFRYIGMAIKADSTYCLPYTTLAELYGLKGDMDSFFINLERAFKLKCNPDDINEGSEPYRSVVGLERYEKLKKKFLVQKSPNSN